MLENACLRLFGAVKTAVFMHTGGAEIQPIANYTHVRRVIICGQARQGVFPPVHQIVAGKNLPTLRGTGSTDS